MLTLLLTIIIFSVLVLVHEFGHFIVAKKSGMKVEEFGWGLPPRAKTLWTDKSGTKYTINWIPFGGFVRLYGEQDPTRDVSEMGETAPLHKGGRGVEQTEDISNKVEQKTLDSEFLRRGGPNSSRPFALFPLWQRMLVVVAGVVMNLVLAVVLLTIVFSVGFMPMAIVPDGTLPMDSYLVQSESFAVQNRVVIPMEQNNGILVDKVELGSGAEVAGISSGDKIVQVGDTKATSPQQLIELLKAARGTAIKLQISRGEEMIEKTITLAIDKPFGVYINAGVQYQPLKFSPPIAFVHAVEEVGKQSILTAVMLKNTLVQLVETRSVPEGVSGPVGIFQMTGEVAQFGIVPTLIFMALLSVSLAVMNILPFPALDGGRFLFLIVELITRKKPSPKFEMITHAVGFLMLISLILVITWNDIGKLWA